MSPWTLLRRVLTAGLLLLVAIPAWANSPLAESEAEKARQLVRQLGAPNYRSREDASGQLIRMGSAVEPILREGLNYPDAEVRHRCRHILPLAMTYDLELRLQAFLGGKQDNLTPASWSRFKAVVGDNPKTRELFANMHRYDTEFLAALEKKPATLQDKMQARCVDFMQMQNSGGGNPPVQVDQLAFMLFASLEPKLKLNPESQSYLSSALHSLSYRPRAKELMKNNDAIRKLLLAYITEGGPYTANNGLYILANLELKEAVDVARSFLKKAENDSYTKGMAVSILGKFGGKEVIPEVLPFLEDKTSMGETQFGNGNRIKTQMRDVALATLVQLTGQSLNDYEFAYLKMFGGRNVGLNVHLSPSLLGFADDPARDAALKKWSSWYAKNKDTLTKK